MNCLMKSPYYIVYADDSVRHLCKPVFRDNGGLVYMSLKYLTLKMETFISVYVCAYNLYES